MVHNLKTRPDKELVQPTLKNWSHWCDRLEGELQNLKQKIEAEKKHHQDNRFRNGQLNILERIEA